MSTLDSKHPPTFEEVQTLWRAECARLLPKWFHRLIVLMPILGCVLFSYNIYVALSAGMAPSASELTLHDIVFIAGFLLICLPLLYLPWVWFLLPPAPTPDNYLKTLERLQSRRHSAAR